MKKHVPSVCLAIAAAAITFAFMSTVPVAGQQPDRKQERWNYLVTPANEDALKKAIGPEYELVCVTKLEGQDGMKFIFKHHVK
jgi:hypothetical protein